MPPVTTTLIAWEDSSTWHPKVYRFLRPRLKHDAIATWQSRDDLNDLYRKQINVVRSLVNGIIGEPKTSYSRRPVPLTEELAAVLLRWRAITPYAGEDDWVFASPSSFGKQPYWPDSMMYKRIRPAALQAGIEKEFSWHSFRRTTASLLISGGASIRTTQEILRHASPSMTLGTYAQSVSSERMAAQQSIASLFPYWPLNGPSDEPKSESN